MQTGLRRVAGCVACAGLLLATCALANEPSTDSEPYASGPDLKNPKPRYPVPLRRSGYEGMVVLRVLVDKEGKVRELEVKQSAHPLLEQSTVEAVLDWKFVPAQRDGEPIEAWVIVPVNYRLTRDPASRRLSAPSAPYSIQGKDNQDTLPAELRYETPATVQIAVAAVYPRELLRQRITGSATVTGIIGTDGKAHAVTVVKSTHPEFGHATTAMLEAWRFEPARRKDGSAVPSGIRFKRGFSLDEADMYVDPFALELLREDERDRPQVHAASELDALPRVRYRPLPTYPREMQQTHIEETVMVEFIVDEKGAVFLPEAVQFQNARLAWSAATAVGRWRFAPPLKDGKPVNARLKVPIAFRLNNNTE